MAKGHADTPRCQGQCQSLKCELHAMHGMNQLRRDFKLVFSRRGHPMGLGENHFSGASPKASQSFRSPTSNDTTESSISTFSFGGASIIEQPSISTFSFNGHSTMVVPPISTVSFKGNSAIVEALLCLRCDGNPPVRFQMMKAVSPRIIKPPNEPPTTPPTMAVSGGL